MEFQGGGKKRKIKTYTEPKTIQLQVAARKLGVVVINKVLTYSAHPCFYDLGFMLHLYNWSLSLSLS